MWLKMGKIHYHYLTVPLLQEMGNEKKKMNEFQQLHLLSCREYKEIGQVAENGLNLLPEF